MPKRKSFQLLLLSIFGEACWLDRLPVGLLCRSSLGLDEASLDAQSKMTFRANPILEWADLRYYYLKSTGTGALKKRCHEITSMILAPVFTAWFNLSYSTTARNNEVPIRVDVSYGRKSQL